MKCRKLHATQSRSSIVCIYRVHNTGAQIAVFFSGIVMRHDCLVVMKVLNTRRGKLSATLFVLAYTLLYW